jgi:methylenetetrahydrofolate reductase (NADPH)
LNYAMRCGVGPSIRAIGSRGSALTRLIGERGPERIVRDLARAYLAGDLDIDGLHLYSFGGLLRTCRWFRAVADGRFDLDDDGSFSLTSAY